MSPRFPPSERKGTGSQAIGRRSGRVDTYNLLKDDKVVPYTENAVGSGLINPFGETGRRIMDNLLSIWWFTEGAGTIVQDRAALTTANDLSILSGTTWSQDAAYNDRYFLSFSGGGYVQGDAKELQNALRLQTFKQIPNEFTVEAWIKPDNVSQQGPARIITIAEYGFGTKSSNYMVGQGHWSPHTPATMYDTRVRLETSAEDPTGVDRRTPDGTATTGLQHVVLTVSGAPNYIAYDVYVNGNNSSSGISLQLPYPTSFGATSFLTQNWTNPDGNKNESKIHYYLEIGSTFAPPQIPSRPWYGGVYLMAHYSKALTAGQVLANYNAGVTTDSILPVPVASMSEPLTSSGFADNSIMSCTMSIPGNRSTVLSATYGVSSAEGLVENTDYVTKTDKTFLIDPDEYTKTIKIQPLTLSCPDGTISVVLSGLSVGTATGEHVMSVSSLVSSVNVKFANATPSVSPKSSTTNVEFRLQRPFVNGGTEYACPYVSPIDVCCVGLSGASNAGTYYMIDANDSTLKSFDGASYATGKVASGTTGIGSDSTLVVSADPLYGFVPGDVLYISALGVSSMSAITLGGEDPIVSGTSSIVLIVENKIDKSKPNQFNTGISALGWSINSLKVPDNEPWWDNANGYVVSDGAYIVGYKFVDRGGPDLRADNITFSGCYIKSTGTWGIRADQNVHTNTKDHMPSGIKMYYSEVCTDMSQQSKEKLIKSGEWDTIHRSNLHHAYSDLIHVNISDPASISTPGDTVVQTISENYLHETGADTRACCAAGTCECAHADGYQNGGSTSGMVIVSGNTIEMQKANLLTTDTWGSSYICNCYAPQTAPPGLSWKSNQCVRLVADGGAKGGYYLGHAWVCDNWLNGGNTTVVVGGKNTGDICHNVTASGNFHGRDFWGSPYTTSNGTYTGTVTIQYNVWEDDGSPVAKDPGAGYAWSGYSRYRCVTETGYCPQSTWNCDANDPCTCSSVCI
jgi:hypothetical protein